MELHEQSVGGVPSSMCDGTQVGKLNLDWYRVVGRDQVFRGGIK